MKVNPADLPSYDDQAELEETIFGIIRQQIEDLYDGETIEKLVEKMVKKKIETIVEKSLHTYLGIDTRWSDIEIKHGGVLYEALEAKLRPMIGPAIDKIVGKELELDPEWVKAVEQEATEQARHEVHNHLTGRVFSTHGLDRDITGPINQIVQEAAEKVAIEETAKALLKGMPT